MSILSESPTVRAPSRFFRFCRFFRFFLFLLFLLFLFPLALGLPARTASANGRFPAASQLVTHPRDPSHMVLRTSYGLLLSSDGGATWDWVCERAVGYGGIEDPSLSISAGGAILAGMFEGLTISSDHGCSWARTTAVPEVVVDLTSRPSEPDTLYAITGKYAGRDAGALLFHSELHVTTDAGATWSLRGSLDPTLLLESVEVAPSSAARLYLTAVREVDAAKHAVLLTSDDGGVHWVEHAVPLEAKEKAIFVAGVDASRPERVYLRTSGPETNRLLVSDDGGKTSRTIFRGGALLGFALSERGDEVYVGGPTDGLQVSAVSGAGIAADYRFEKRWPMAVQCLAVRGQTLWACSSPQSGFELGSSEDDGRSWKPRLTLQGMRGPLACSGASTTKECAPEWDRLRGDLGLKASQKDADASPRPAGSTDTSAPGPGHRCSCSVPGAATASGGAYGSFLTMIAGTLGLAVRRLSRLRPRHRRHHHHHRLRHPRHRRRGACGRRHRRSGRRSWPPIRSARKA
jgi:photosystem II stability/assembly factor-like uncharacterized protein